MLKILTRVLIERYYYPLMTYDGELEVEAFHFLLREAYLIW